MSLFCHSTLAVQLKTEFPKTQTNPPFYVIAVSNRNPNLVSSFQAGIDHLKPYFEASKIAINQFPPSIEIQNSNIPWSPSVV